MITPIEVEVREGLVVRPGDTLIIRVRANIPPEQLHEFAEKLKAQLPDVKCVVINAEEIAAYRPGEHDDQS